MSQRVTPYKLTATRSHPKKTENRDAPLLLASLSRTGTVDLLDAVEEHVTTIEPWAGKDRWVRCVEVERSGDHAVLLLACDAKGEREAVLDAEQDGSPVVFMKGEGHVGRVYAFVFVGRKPNAREGLLVVHSPWRRGGSVTAVRTLLSRAVREEKEARAKLRTDPFMRPDLLLKMLRSQQLTRIEYKRERRIVSPFGGQTSATAEVQYVLRGKETTGYKRAFQTDLVKKLESGASLDDLLTVKVPSGDGEDEEEETFVDATVSFGSDTSAGRYSLTEDFAPRMSLDIASRLNPVFYGLPAEDSDEVRKELMSEGRAIIVDAARSVGWST